MIVRLHGLLQSPRHIGDALEIDIWSDSSRLEDLLPEGNDFHLELVSLLPQGSRGIRVFRKSPT